MISAEVVRTTPVVGFGDRVYPSTKLAATYDVLVGQGLASEEILRDVEIAAEDVHSPRTRISLDQLVKSYRNAFRLSKDRHLPYRIGSNIHVSTYGMYGYAILCCPDFRKAMAFAMRYQALAAPAAAIDFREEGAAATWTIVPDPHAATDARLYRFISEKQIGIIVSLMRDVMGSDFAVQEIRLTYTRSDDFGLADDLVGCRVRFAQPANQIVFGSAWLDRPASLGNRTTYPAIVALCDELLGDLKLRVGVAGRIREILLRDIANPPTLEVTARLLDVNERSLRRQLRQQGFSFGSLRDELRMQLALNYLRGTNLPNEDIAPALGYSDAANFRRAFRRWTGKTPNEVRASGKLDAFVPANVGRPGS